MGGGYNWPAVAQRIEASSPHLEKQVLDMTKFVHRYSGGGDKGIFLEELDLWSKQLRSRCDVSGNTFRVLGEAEFSSGPEMIVAMLKAAYVSPENHQRMGISTLITSTDVATVINKKRAQAIQLCDMVRKAKKLYHDHTDTLMEHHAYVKICGDMEVRAAMFIMNKKAPRRRVFSSLEEIAAEWWAEVRNAAPPSFNAECPVKINVAPSSACGATSQQM
eukprot:4949498-Pyramimonas_sp.AAC.1